MALYPENSTIPFKNPIQMRLRFKTLTNAFDDLGEERRKRKFLYPRRDITLAYEWLSVSDAQTLWEFYVARSGPYEAFNFFLPSPDTYTGEYVGSGDGSTTVMNLPSKSGSSTTVYLDGVEKTGGGTDYTFGSGTGEDGADKITWVAAPAAAQRVTYDFTGYLKVRSRFKEDYLDFETFYGLLCSMGVPLQGLLNA